mmetsp:Transcript_2006/g.3118  ORF Transcript_2006/g.3118 Transcript_2006/m.3118 type:complete len:275 (+) Transcript_2006:785-1609(+)
MYFPLFQKQAPEVGLTYASQPSRATAAEKTSLAMTIPGVKESTAVLFYHGYDCSPWICKDEDEDGNSANVTCPELRDSVDLIDGLHHLFPTYPLWMSEVCYAEEYGSYLGPDGGCPALPFADFEDSLQWGKMIVADLTVGHASAWIYWNMILDENGGPHMTNPKHNDPEVDIQQPLVIVNTSNDEISLTGAYYALAHFGRYVLRGSVRIGAKSTTSVNVHFAAFVDSDEQRVIVQLVNDSQEKNTVILEFGDFTSTSLTLTPISITTLRFLINE